MKLKEQILKIAKDSPAVAKAAKITGVITLIAATIPTVIEGMDSYKTGVSFGNSNRALAQHRMWQKNFDCTKKNKFSYIENRHGIKIGSIVCGSGDILISGKKPGGATIPVLKWVSLRSVFEAEDSPVMHKISFIPVAFADDMMTVSFSGDIGESKILNNKTQLCHIKTLNKKSISMRMQGKGAICEDMKYNTYTGALVNIKPAPCNCEEL